MISVVRPDFEEEKAISNETIIRPRSSKISIEQRRRVWRQDFRDFTISSVRSGTSEEQLTLESDWERHR